MSLESAISSLVSRLETVSARLESVERQLSQGGSPSSGGSVQEVSSASVQEYEDLISQYINPYVELSSKIGDDVFEQAQLVLNAVNAQRDFLKIAASSKKPSDSVFANLFKSTSDLCQQVVSLKESKRTSKNSNHLAAVSEGISALSWVGVSPTPGPFVAEMRGSSEFWSNRILKDFKGKDQNHVDWVSLYNNFLKELQAYIKKNHTTGLTWNPKGGDASEAVSEGFSTGAPPPPPGPPPPADDTPSTSSNKSGPDMSGLFSAINKGTDVSKGLKKVTSDMKTKNRDHSEKSSVVHASGPAPKSAPKTESKHSASKPPKLALEGNKWIIEYQKQNRQIVLSDTEPKHTIYIYKCSDSTIQIKGKVNAVTVDDCSKTAVVFENAIASFEVVNCRSVEIQVTGSVPSIAVDKTSGCQIYLSKTALNTEITTSKSSEMNVLLPEGDDMTEIPIPEQYKTTVKNGRLFTEVVQHV